MILSLPAPSLAQQAIIDAFNRRDNRALFVSAVAGSGKTTALRHIISAIPESRHRFTVYCAFGKKNQQEMSTKLPPGVNCRTIHSLGLGVLKHGLTARGIAIADDHVDYNKYADLARYWCAMNNLDPVAGHPDFKQEDLVEFRGAVKDAAHFVMVTLSAPTPADIAALCAHYDISVCPDLVTELYRAVPQIIEWGWEGVCVSEEGRKWNIGNSISADDMLYWPWRYDMKPKFTYSNILVDEAQDLSAAQRDMARRIGANDRFPAKNVFVGDANQSIFGFSGADCESVNRIITDFDAIQLPLDVCYRCPSGAIDMASRIVPHIVAKPGAPAGEMYHATMDQACDNTVAGDMWMCRLTAPLVGVYYALLAKGKPAKLLGRDQSAPLKAILQALEGIKDFDIARFPDYVFQYRDARMKNLEKRKNAERLIQKLVDETSALLAIYDAICERIKSLDDIMREMEMLFSDQPGECILLATAHRCKGLEAQRTFILNPESMPFARAYGWHLQQEWNLLYVALTRTMEFMCFVGKEAHKLMGQRQHPIFALPLAEGRIDMPILPLVKPSVLQEPAEQDAVPHADEPPAQLHLDIEQEHADETCSERSGMKNTKTLQPYQQELLGFLNEESGQTVKEIKHRYCDKYSDMPDPVSCSALIKRLHALERQGYARYEKRGTRGEWRRVAAELVSAAA